MAFSDSGQGTGSGKNGTYFRTKYGRFEKGSKSKGNIEDLGDRFEGILMKVSREDEKPQYQVPAQWILHFQDPADGKLWNLTLPVERKSTYTFLNDFAGLSDEQMLGSIKLKSWCSEKEITTDAGVKKTVKRNGIAIRLGDWEDWENRPTGKFPYLKRDQHPEHGVVYFQGGKPIMIPDGSGKQVPFMKDGKVQMEYNTAENFCKQHVMRHIFTVLKASGRLDQVEKESEIPGDDPIAPIAHDKSFARNESLPAPPPPPLVPEATYVPPVPAEIAGNGVATNSSLDDLPF